MPFTTVYGVVVAVYGATMCRLWASLCELAEDGANKELLDFLCET